MGQGASSPISAALARLPWNWRDYGVNRAGLPVVSKIRRHRAGKIGAGKKNRTPRRTSYLCKIHADQPEPVHKANYIAFSTALEAASTALSASAAMLSAAISTASAALSTTSAALSTASVASCDPPQAASVIRPAAASTNVSFFTQTSQPCWQDGGCAIFSRRT